TARVRPALAEDGDQQLGGPVGHEVLLREGRRAVDEHHELHDALDALEVAQGRLQRAHQVDGDGPRRLAPFRGGHTRAELAHPRLALALCGMGRPEREAAPPHRWALTPLTM